MIFSIVFIKGRKYNKNLCQNSVVMIDILKKDNNLQQRIYKTHCTIKCSEWRFNYNLHLHNQMG